MTTSSFREYPSDAATARVAALQTKKKKLTKREIREIEQKCRLKHFDLWCDYIDEIKAARKTAMRCLKGCSIRYKRNAWQKWRFGEFEDFGPPSPVKIIGLGGRLLKQASASRAENEEMLDRFKELSTLRSEVARLAYTKRQ